MTISTVPGVAYHSDLEGLAAELAAIGPQNAAVFIIGGQSNANGSGVGTPISPPSPAVWMLDKGEVYRMATEPIGEQPVGWVNNIPGGVTPGQPKQSFAVQMGKFVCREAGGQALIVPCAIGSTSLTHWQKPAGALDMSTLFGALILRAQKAQRAGASPVFVWFGHESNASSTTLTLSTGTIGTAYADAWETLILQVREFFPSAPFIFCQLSITNTDSQKYCTTGEIQRRSHDAGGLYRHKTGEQPFNLRNTNATNTLTINADGSLSMVGDGSTTLGAEYTGVAGQTYAMDITVTGAGLFKLTAINDKYTAQGPGTYNYTFTADGTGVIGLYRNSPGQVTNLTFRITRFVCTSATQIQNTFLVATHDVIRNSGSDSQHLSTAGLQEVGRRIALMYADRVLGLDGVDGLGPRFVSATIQSSTQTKVKFSQSIAAAKEGEANYSDGTDSLFRVYDAGTERAVSSVVIDGTDPTALIVTHAAVSGLRFVMYGDRFGQETLSRKGVVYNMAAIPLPSPMFATIAT